MPFIHVRSLPFKTPLEMGSVLEGISHDFAENNGIAVEHVTVTWEFLLPNHYAVAGHVSETQTVTTHPVIVDLLTPARSGKTQPSNRKMLLTLATSLAQRAYLPINNIFINHRYTQPGHVFDAGGIVET
jgi:hypothetical protein